MKFFMRLLKISVYVLLLAFGVYSALWYVNARANFQYIQNWLNSAAQKDYITTLTYDDLHIQGFPFHIDVAIENPTIELDLRKLPEPFGTAVLELYGIASKAPGIEMSTPQSIKLRGNVMGSSYSLLFHENMQYRFKTSKGDLPFDEQNKEAAFKISLDCWKTLLHYRNLEQLLSEKAMKTHQENEFSVFKEIGIYAKDIKSIDPETNDLYYEAKKIHYALKRDLSDEGQSLSLKIQTKDFVSTKAYYEAEKKIMPGDSMPYADHGPMNFDIHLFYEGPTNAKAFISESTAVKLKADIQFDSQLYTFDNEATLKGQFGEKNRFDLDANGHIKFKEGSHPQIVALYKESLETLKNRLDVLSRQPQGPKPVMPSTWAFWQDHLQDIPPLHELGDIEYTVQVSGVNEGVQIEFDIPKISFKNDLYAWALDADFKQSLFKPMPEGEVHFKLEALDALMTRMNRYFDLLRNYYNSTNQQMPYYLTQKDFSQNLTDFLTKLGKSEDDALTFDIKLDNEAPFGEVNDQTMMQVLVTLGGLFTSKADDANQVTDDHQSESEDDSD